MHERWALAAVLVAAAGCAPDHGAWDRVAIEEAWLERFDLSALTIVIGSVQGDALLVFTEAGGNVGAVPVHLGGGTLGIALDLSADPEGHEGVVDVDLTDVDAPTVGDVFGTYHGTGSSGAAVAGGSRRRMKNGAGASFREDHFALGLSLYAGYQWVTIREGGNDGEEHEPFLSFTDDDPVDTAPPDPTTGSGSDTRPTAEPTPSSSGCNSDDDGGDDDDEGSDDDDDDGGTSPPPSSGGGSASGGSSSSCGDASGCACSTGSGAPLGFTAALLFLRFRRAGSGASRRRAASACPSRTGHRPPP
jgi:hypothetical protein